MTNPNEYRAKAELAEAFVPASQLPVRIDQLHGTHVNVYDLTLQSRATGTLHSTLVLERLTGSDDDRWWTIEWCSDGPVVLHHSSDEMRQMMLLDGLRNAMVKATPHNTHLLDA